MAFESKTIEHLARYLVSGSNGFGACELVQLRTGIAGSHAWAVWMIIAIIDGKLDRRAERHSGHALNAARQDYVHGSAHHRLRGKVRSEEHTSELQSLMRISYAVFCWKKKNTQETQGQN